MVKLATYVGQDGPRVGIVSNEILHPLSGVHELRDLLGLRPRQVAEMADDAVRIPLDAVTLTAPIPSPRRNLFCVGWNYLAHFEEGKRSRPEVDLPAEPTFFTKATTTVAGPHDHLPMQIDYSERLDWEVELAIIIGRPCRDVSREDAVNHVFGFTVANDVTARDLQSGHGGQWFKGKSLDQTCPMGPYVVTADELHLDAGFRITCRVNGECVQDAHSSQMIFPIDDVIARLSRGLTLLPGDIILTGTPDGVGHHRKPSRYLRDGDVLESDIDFIGTMRNVLGA